MTWRRHLRMVCATLALWVLAIVALATKARTWLERHLGRGARIPSGVHMLVAAAPDEMSGEASDEASAEVTTIDITEHDLATAGSSSR